MLSIGRHTDYAARLVLHLASLGDDVQVTIREVAEERLLPMPFVRRIVGQLAQAGIVTAVRGAGGGIRLARPADKITLLDVVEALEGPVTLNRCVPGGEGCPLSERCPINCIWVGVNRQVRDNLAKARFDVLAHTPRHQQAHRLQHAATVGRRKVTA
ncbi:Rrf2 family transcriptional regulator [Opitutus sp. ER46]|uniref:RrF2 family transcriptional regulator n=1 Tax=Opitutus sp. ER46 TaxID=2161864 RepID=UPI000D3035E9|nr:Rrf2 family transcriptional regulator [Opitutus sp. ER46]PTX94598.1 hypothetical protein DB354_12765 [Opitutus sp. ER46]